MKKQINDIKKNDTFELEITAVTSDGSGLGRKNNVAIFVPGAVIGDKIIVRIIKLYKNYCIGKLMEIIVPSKDRIPIDCECFSKCGGCIFRQISYEKELEIKEQRVKDAIERIGEIKNIKYNPIIGGDSPDRYRNKSMMPISTAKDGTPLIGFYSRHSHNIVESETCFLQPTIFDDIKNIFKQWIIDFKISVYNETLETGLIRNLYLRESKTSDEVMVCIVAQNSKIPHIDDLIKRLLNYSSKIVSIILNINRENTNVVLGKQFITLYGKDSINDKLCGCEFKLSPASFYQVNSNQTEKLYNTALSFCDFKGEETVIDLYCGTGTIGLIAASYSKKVIGIEINPDAIRDAKKNAKNNNINNIEFICEDASNAALTLKDRNIKADVVIIDPPRKGCDTELINTISYFEPKKIVYISCNVSTQARDLKEFEKIGYKPLEITPVNMFPRTEHVETVCLLSRR